MYNPAAKTGLAGEMLGQVDRIVVARKLGEPDHVFVLDCLADRRPHADGKVFEIERPKQGVLHAANETFNRWELTEKITRRQSVDERQIEPALRPSTAEARGSRRPATMHSPRTTAAVQPHPPAKPAPLRAKTDECPQ